MTLMSLADGADLLFTTLSFEQAAANVAEYYDIPLVTLHYFPARVNGQLIPFLPAPLGRNGMTVSEWLHWRVVFRKIEDAQRRELGLPKATSPAPRRITERGSLEIQAYEEFCFPGLAAEWAKWNGQRPFIGALTLDCRPMPMTTSRRGLPREHRRSSSALAAYRSLCCRHACHDRCRLRAVRRARVGLHRLE